MMMMMMMVMPAMPGAPERRCAGAGMVACKREDLQSAWRVLVTTYTPALVTTAGGVLRSTPNI